MNWNTCKILCNLIALFPAVSATWQILFCKRDLQLHFQYKCRMSLNKICSCFVRKFEDSRSVRESWFFTCSIFGGLTVRCPLWAGDLSQMNPHFRFFKLSWLHGAVFGQGNHMGKSGLPHQRVSICQKETKLPKLASFYNTVNMRQWGDLRFVSYALLLHLNGKMLHCISSIPNLSKAVPPYKTA